jgi:hypothetical protein
MTRSGYRRHLQAVVASSAAPYGYTLTLWTAGAISTHAQHALPSSTDALLLLAGAVVGFGAVGAYAFGSINGVLAPEAHGEVRVWGGLHLPSVGLSILGVSILNQVVRGWAIWPLVGFVSTAMYLLVIGAQFLMSNHRAHAPASSGPADGN